MESFAAFTEVILLSFSPIALALFVLAYAKKSSKPLVAAGVLFIAYAFDSFVMSFPFLFSSAYQQFGHWNWEGKILSFLWPWIVIFLFKWLSAEEVGLKLRNPVKGSLYGLIFGLILGGWNVLDGYFFTDLPAEKTIESIAFQLFAPGLDEELVFRGVFLAILVRYLGKGWKVNSFSFGWGIILVSLLFINVHLIGIDRATGQFIWTGTPNLLGNISVATAALAYLRLKTESIWPGVICHGLINSLPVIAA